MKFEKYVEDSVRGRKSHSKRAILNPTGVISFNRAAICELGLDESTYLLLHYAKEEAVIGLKPLDKQEKGSRKVSMGKSGAHISVKAFLRHYDIAIEEATRFEPVVDEGENMILIDLDSPVDVNGK